jgi:hypothetical protein
VIRDADAGDCASIPGRILTGFAMDLSSVL